MKTILLKRKPLLFTACVLASVWLGGLAQAAIPYASVTVEGALSPGVYGRIEIGTALPPPLIYAQPIIVYRASAVVQQPVYLHVPPGHAKKWSKHCAKYNACRQPVYFVRVDGDEDFERVKSQEDQEKKNKKEKHHAKGKGGHHD